MRNPAIAVMCGPCAVAINPALHPQPDTVISCPECGATDTFRTVMSACLQEADGRFALAINAKRPPAKPSKWRFRDTNR